MLKIFVEQAFDELKENIGEEVLITGYKDGKLKYYDGFIYEVIDYQGISVGGKFGLYMPFVGLREGILSIQLKNSKKTLYKNTLLVCIDHNLSNEDWIIEALRITYGEEYLKEYYRKKKKDEKEFQIKNDLFDKDKKSYTKEEIELIDKMELEKSLRFVYDEISKNNHTNMPSSIKTKLYDTGMLYVRYDRYDEWHTFVDRLFTCGVCVTAIKATIEILHQLNEFNCKTVLDEVLFDKYEFLPESLRYTIMNALIYFSPYGSKIRPFAPFRNEQLDIKKNKQM